MEPLKEVIQYNLQIFTVNKEETSIDSVPAELIQIIFPKVQDFNSSIRVSKRWNVYLNPLSLQKEFVRLKNLCCPDVVEQAHNLEGVSRRLADIGKMDKALEVARCTRSSWCNGNLPNRGNAFAYIINKQLENKLPQEAIKIANSMPIGMYEDIGFEKVAYVFSNHQLPDQVDLMIHKISQKHIRNRTIQSIAIRHEDKDLLNLKTKRKLTVVLFESENPGYGEKIVGQLAKLELYDKIAKLSYAFKIPKNEIEKNLLWKLMEQIDKSEKMEESEENAILIQLTKMVFDRNLPTNVKTGLH